MKLIEIRGCTGSGKSTLMRQVMAELNLERHPSWDGYSNDDVVVLGNYAMETGGLENRYTLTDNWFRKERRE